LKTDKFDNNGTEISIGDRVVITTGHGFRGLGDVVIRNGAILIDWITPKPVENADDYLSSYGDVEIVSKDVKTISFHEAVQ
jgi:transcription elongation factor